MKRKNFILSALLSVAVIITSACAEYDLSSTTVITKSDTTTDVVTAETSTTELKEFTENTSLDTTEEAIVTSTEITTTTTIETAGVLTSEAVTTITETTTVSTEAITAVETTTAVTETTTTEESTKEILATTAEATTEETVMTENTKKKYIALTFDDGPNTTTTVEVLDVLEQYGIKASFFLVGNNINSNTEAVVKRAYDMGCEIGNHSKSHAYLNELTSEDVKAEVDYVNDYILKLTGEEPKFFRPPYIAVSPVMYDVIDMPFICGFGCNDWDDRVPAERRSAVILRQVQDGGIILLHDAQGNSKTVEALHTIIPELQAQGYEFVTVSELFEIKGIEIRSDDSGLHTFVGQ